MADTSLVSESRAWSEYLALRRDPVFRGDGVPAGDGRAVLVLPGLFGNDFYLQPLRSWLRRLGYRPLASTIALNVGCPERIRERVAGVIRGRAGAAAPLTILGHSRGGMLGKALACTPGIDCDCFIALGSPLGAVLGAGHEGLRSLAADEPATSQALAAESVVRAGRGAMRLFSPDCRFPECDCAYLDALLAPLPEHTRAHAIYSTDDPVVAPAASPLPDHVTGAVNVEVTGSHSGLVVNAAVYRYLGQMLAGRL